MGISRAVSGSPAFYNIFLQFRLPRPTVDVGKQAGKEECRCVVSVDDITRGEEGRGPCVVVNLTTYNKP